MTLTAARLGLQGGVLVSERLWSSQRVDGGACRWAGQPADRSPHHGCGAATPLCPSCPLLRETWSPGQCLVPAHPPVLISVMRCVGSPHTSSISSQASILPCIMSPNRTPGRATTLTLAGSLVLILARGRSWAQTGRCHIDPGVSWV